MIERSRIHKLRGRRHTWGSIGWILSMLAIVAIDMETVDLLR